MGRWLALLGWSSGSPSSYVAAGQSGGPGAAPPRVPLAGVPGTCGPGGDINVMGLGARFGFFQQGLGMHILHSGPLRSADCLVELDSIRG